MCFIPARRARRKITSESLPPEYEISTVPLRSKSRNSLITSLSLSLYAFLHRRFFGEFKQLYRLFYFLVKVAHNVITKIKPLGLQRPWVFTTFVVCLSSAGRLQTACLGVCWRKGTVFLRTIAKISVKNFLWYDRVPNQTNYYTISYKTFRYEVVLPS